MIITFSPRMRAQDGTVLGGRFVNLGTTGDEHFSRLRAIMLFGTEWAFLYETAEEAGATKYGLTEYAIPRGWLAHSVPAHRDGKVCDTCSRLRNGVRSTSMT
jgi:hypothetical protein